MPLVKVVLNYSYGNKSTYIDYKYSNFNEFKKQITNVFPNLQLPNTTYKMYWVDNSGAGRFLVNKGHYFDKYVEQSISSARPITCSNAQTALSHHLLIEMDNMQQPINFSAINEIIQAIDTNNGGQTQEPPLTIPIDNRIPASISRNLAFLNCITDEKWQTIAKYSATTKGPGHDYRVRHVGIRCNGCDAEEIAGVRYKCIQCPAYNLCTVCSVFRQMHSDHNMIKMANTTEEINQKLCLNKFAIDAIRRNLLETLQRTPKELALFENCTKLWDLIGNTDDTFSSLMENISVLLNPDYAKSLPSSNVLDAKNRILSTILNEPSTSSSHVHSQRELKIENNIQKTLQSNLHTSRFTMLDMPLSHSFSETYPKYMESVRKSIESINIKEKLADDAEMLSGWTVITKDEINDIEKSDAPKPSTSAAANDKEKPPHPKYNFSKVNFHNYVAPNYNRIAENIQNQIEENFSDSREYKISSPSTILHKIPLNLCMCL